MRIKNKLQITNYKCSGFTLIEIIVVVAIIGILATVVIISLSGAQAKARDSQRVSDIKQIQSAVEMYHEVNNKYPGKKDVPYQSNDVYNNVWWNGPSSSTTYDGQFLTDISNYINPLPQDPRCGNGKCSINELAYRYAWGVNLSNVNSYEIDAGMEVRKDLVSNDGGIRQGTTGVLGGGLYGRYEIGTNLMLLDCCSLEGFNAAPGSELRNLCSVRLGSSYDSTNPADQGVCHRY